MLTGRLLLMLVVMTATLAVRTPAVTNATTSSTETSALPVERTTWVQRLGTGVTRSFSRIGLMQRVALRVPALRLSRLADRTTRPLARRRPDPLRTCLPPPTAA